MIAVRRLYVIAAGLAAAAIACFVVALLRRHNADDALSGLVEGAYFDRSKGDPAFGANLDVDVLTPFRPLNSYLWLGLAIGFAVTSVTLAAATRLLRLQLNTK